MKRLYFLLLFLLLVTSFITPLAVASENVDHPAKSRQEPLLKGRLEEMAAPACTLPGGISVGSLQKETPKMAPDPRLEGFIAGYPEYLLGKWGGDLTVTLDIARDGEPRFSVGEKCTSLFNFDKGPRGIFLHPTTLFFGLTKEKLGNRQIGELDSLKRYYEEQGRPLTQNTVLETVTEISLVPIKYKGIDGSSSSYDLLSNTLRELRRGAVEHDLVQSKKEIDARGRSTCQYQEFVSRFTWYRKDLVLAQIGKAEFDDSGNAIERQILQGWISPNWRESAVKLLTQMKQSRETIQQSTGVDVSELQSGTK